MRVLILLATFCCSVQRAARRRSHPAVGRAPEPGSRRVSKAGAQRRRPGDAVPARAKAADGRLPRAHRRERQQLRRRPGRSGGSSPNTASRRLPDEGGAIHELRRVTSLDGRKLQDTKKAQDELAAIVMAGDDKRKKELLTQFEKYGLLGAVTDFGQLLLLFTSGDVKHYEFTFRRMENQGTAHLLVFGYQQIDGAEALTVVDARRGQEARNVRLSGEVWVRGEQLSSGARHAAQRPATSPGPGARRSFGRIRDVAVRRAAAVLHRASRAARHNRGRREQVQLHGFPQVRRFQRHQVRAEMTQVVYLHGFASGPDSSKAQFFRRKFAERGVAIEIPQLDEGDFEAPDHLRTARR